MTPQVRIIEQPPKSIRYRYLSEKRKGTIRRSHIVDTPTHTPFAIDLPGYTGRAIIVVSCVTREPPYRVHPHSLVGDHCVDGYYLHTHVIDGQGVVKFGKLAIQCEKRELVGDAIKKRKAKNVDPFKHGFGHIEDVKSIDMHAVRLCVQVFLKSDSECIPLAPVVSEPIINRRTIQDPKILRLSHCNSLVSGRDEEIILLCTKIVPTDIQIRFFETKNDHLIWEDYGHFHTSGIFNNSAICFRPPVYHNQNIIEPVMVSIQLVRPSDDITSPSIPFQYLPVATVLKKKRLNNFNDLMTTSGGAPEENMNKKKRLDDLSEFLIDLQEPSTSAYVPNVVEAKIEDPFSSTNLESLPDMFLNLGASNELQPIHISSGELDNDMNRLSGNLQENLVVL